ncbi:MAG: hypothetical protein ACI837_002128 [Crocinitomicaceae bacterium]|jgi:hypothetical protein
MEVLRKEEDEFLVYEESELAILVAIRKVDQLQIKNYWKKKEASTEPDKTISGFPFIHSDEQESLKIDFTQEGNYLIRNLKKFS